MTDPGERPAAGGGGIIQSLLVAIQFLTRLPVGRALPVDAYAPERFRQAMLCFPLVGAAIGGATALVFKLGLYLWSPWVAVLVALSFEALLTGALHEDAVADFCDAFGGGRDAEAILRILKDSRVGSYGVLGLMLAVGMRAAAMVALPIDLSVPAIIAAAALGRWLIVPVALWLPPLAGREGLASDLMHPDRGRALALSMLAVVPGIVWIAVIAPERFGLMLLGLVVFALWLVRFVGRRLGGSTGDVLGFACYGGQVIALLMVATRL